VAMLGGQATAGALGAASEFLVPAGIATGLAGTLAFGLDALNPFSGDGFGSRGSVGRGLSPGDGVTATFYVDSATLDAAALGDLVDQFIQQASAPGRWLTDGAKSTATWLGAAGGAVTAVGGALGQAGVAAAGGELISAGAGIAAAGDLVAGLDYVNPFSGDGFGSQGNVGRGIAATPQVVPGRYLNHKADENELLLPLALVPLILDGLNPLSGEGVSDFGAVGRALHRNNLYSAFDYINPFSGDGVGSYGDVGNPNTSGRYLDNIENPVGNGLASVPLIFDLLNPWSGDGFAEFGTFGRGLGAPGGVAGQMLYYSTGNSVIAPVQFDVGPQGTTISITIPNGYNVGQMGMMPMVPAMSAPQYRVIPQYAAPAQVAYAAPATPANLAVAPPAANAGVKCQVGDQQAVAPTVDACEEAGGLVQPMDAAQAAE
jgi:hypothetical protein